MHPFLGGRRCLCLLARRARCLRQCRRRQAFLRRSQLALLRSCARSRHRCCSCSGAARGSAPPSACDDSGSANCSRCARLDLLGVAGAIWPVRKGHRYHVTFALPLHSVSPCCRRQPWACWQRQQRHIRNSVRVYSSMTVELNVDEYKVLTSLVKFWRGAHTAVVAPVHVRSSPITSSSSYTPPPTVLRLHQCRPSPPASSPASNCNRHRRAAERWRSPARTLKGVAPAAALAAEPSGVAAHLFLWLGTSSYSAIRIIGCLSSGSCSRNQHAHRHGVTPASPTPPPDPSRISA